MSIVHEITEKQNGGYYTGAFDVFMIMVDHKDMRSNRTAKSSKACQIDCYGSIIE